MRRPGRTIHGPTEEWRVDWRTLLELGQAGARDRVVVLVRGGLEDLLQDGPDCEGHAAPVQRRVGGRRASALRSSPSSPSEPLLFSNSTPYFMT